MPDTVTLLSTLLEALRGEASPAPARVADLLADGELSAIAQQILDREAKAFGAQEASDLDLGECLVAALVEGLQSDPTNAAAVARQALAKGLKSLAADAKRQWLVLIPVTADTGPNIDLSESLSTAGEIRLVLGASESPAQLDARIQKACQPLGISTSAVSPAAALTKPLFACKAAGPEDAVIRRGFDILAAGRDALRFAAHAGSDAKDMGPLQRPDAHALRADIWLMDTQGRNVLARTRRNKDIVLEAPAALANPKTRTTYDQAARLLEMYPKGLVKQHKNDFAWRLARSIRIFSRGTQQSNRDLRFLLLLVALEAVLNRSKDSPIAESMSDIGALVTASNVQERLRIAREIKSAYGDRSQFVHQGQLPSDTRGDDGLAEVEGLIFRTWAAVMRKLLPLAEDRLTSDEVFQRFAKLKFGASWDEAFKSAEDAS